MTANGSAEASLERSRQTVHGKPRFAAVPREYERFIRLFARTFLPVRAVVVLDQLVRLRYCTELQLVPILRANPKHLRRLLWQLRDRGLVRSETRVYKKVFPARRPDAPPIVRYRRLFYWWIDYQNAVNVTLYKLHRMQAIVEQRLREAAAGTTDADDGSGSYVCDRCKRAYSALDIPSLLHKDSNELRCTQLIQRGVRCLGLVREVDRSEEISSLRQLRHALDVETRPLAEAASACLLTEAPKHPLDGMDEEQVGALIAAQHADRSSRSEAARTESERAAEYFVGPHELDIEVEVSGPAASAASLDTSKQAMVERAEASAPKTEQPAWFADSSSRLRGQVVEATASEDNHAIVARTLALANDAELDEYADIDFEEAAESESDSGWFDDLDREDSNKPDWSPASELDDVDNALDEATGSSIEHRNVTDTFHPEPNTGATVCLVAGEPIPLEAITAAHTERMSVAEYQRYYELLQQQR
ncbi:hypothetical protein CCYA_CCYA18G4611 [Cyanidiococcus yangmingshanensis]|nr:hypothetical protein CCYA_CCYA18G4611 [Cyanidiococcus yangmingshanensis]